MNASAVWVKYLLSAALSLMPVAALTQQAPPAHPLDALTGAELHQVLAPRIARAVQNLKHIGGALLRIVVFVAERREARDRYKAQAEVSRVL